MGMVSLFIVLCGEKMDSIVETGIFDEREWQDVIDNLSLSPRQAQIIQCLLMGYSDKRIAMELQISISTIRTYLERLFAKLEVVDRGELILYTFRYFRKGCIGDRCPRWQ